MLVMTYGLFVVAINVCLYAVTLYLMGNQGVVFTDAYFVKYLIAASVLAIIVPFVVNLTEVTVSVKVSRSNGES